MTGGESIPGPGYFFTPTVVCEVPADARLLREELFGPIAPIQTFCSEPEAIDAANDTEHGLAAYVYTREHSRAMRVIDELQCGMVALNKGTLSNAAAPFGGIKHSGYGCEGGAEGLAEYLEVKYVAMTR